MRSPVRIAVLLIFTVAVAGCSAPDANLRVWLDRDPQSWQISAEGAVHDRDSLAMTPAADGIDGWLGAQADVEDYVATALARNPAIHAAMARVRRMEARVPQVRSLDDPMLEVSPIGEMAETAAGMVGVMMGLSQRLPFPGKLDEQGHIAEQDVRIAQKELMQVRLEVAAQVRDAYWSYYSAARALELLEQSRGLLEQIRSAARSAYEANRGDQQQVLSVSVELADLENELNNMQQSLESSKALLNSLMDRPIDAELVVPKEVPAREVVVDVQQLMRLAARANPSIRKIDTQIEQYRHRVKLAKLQRWPDVTVMLTYNFVDDDGMSVMANGKDQWGVGFAVNVPIWFDKLRAGEREAYAGMQEQIAQLSAERNRVAYEIRDVALKVQAKQKLLKVFRDQIIPQARQAAQLAMSDYQAGRIDSLALLKRRRELLNYQSLYQQAVAEHEKSLARLGQVVGVDVPVAQAPGAATHDGVRPDAGE